MAEVVCDGSDDEGKGGEALEDSGCVVLSVGAREGDGAREEDGGGEGEEDRGEGEGEGEGDGVGATVLVGMRDSEVVSGISITIEVLEGSRLVIIDDDRLTIVGCTCEDIEMEAGMVVWASVMGQSTRRRR